MSNNPPICILHNSLRTALLFRAPYIKMLKADGHSVHCIAPLDDHNALLDLQQMGVVVHALKSNNPMALFFTLNAKAIILQARHRFKCQIVCHFLSTIVISGPTLLLSKKPVCFIEGVGTFFSQSQFTSGLAKLYLRMTKGKLVFMNEYERDLVGRKKDLVLNGIGVDLTKFSADRTVNKQSKVVRLLYIGRLIRDKGILDVFKVARALQKSGTPFHLSVVGDIYLPNPGSLTKADVDAASKEFGSLITFHGFKEHVTRFYLNSDVLLLLSRHEGFPVVVMEASASAVPAGAYNVPGCRHAIKPGENGFLADEGDVESITNWIISGAYLNLRESCRNYALKHFNAEVKTDTIVEAITQQRN